MDEFYNQHEARELLEFITQSRLSRAPKVVQLTNFSEDHGMAQHCTVSSVDFPKSWKLTHTGSQNGPKEEVVLRIQGIVCDKSLPPIKHPFRVEPRQRKFLKQSIMLTGLGEDFFSKSISNIYNIRDILTREFPRDAIEEWTPSHCGHFDAVDMSNRYFTSRHNMNGEAPVPFQSSTDPEHILANSLSNDFVHLQENEVEYYEAIKGSGDVIQYVAINPIRISIGDIVEAQVPFSIVPLKGKKYKMVIILRAITLLDCSPLKNANFARKMNDGSGLILKRKIGYAGDDDSTESTRAKISKMSID